MTFHAKDLRKGRFSESGRIYYITTATLYRAPSFTEFSAARIVVHALRAEEANANASTLAYVLMPDHLHWLMQLHAGDLSTVVGRVKSTTAHRIGGAVWQAGFHDHALRREEDLLNIARYIVANPLRAGLVERLGEYPHWDAVWL